MTCLVAAGYLVMYEDAGLAVVRHQRPDSCHLPPGPGLHVCDGLFPFCQASVGKHQTDCPTPRSSGLFVVVKYVLWLSNISITGILVTGSLTFLHPHFRQRGRPVLFLWRSIVHGPVVTQRWSARLSIVAIPIIILIIASLWLLLRLLLETWFWVRLIIILGMTLP